MATRRMVPTNFFRDPDILNLQDHTTRLILIGLILFADDEGREIAHAQLLSRELDYPSEQIEAALQDLAINDLIILYQVGKHRYYSLTRWGKWQTINPNRMTRSKYPAPPVPEMSEVRPPSYAQPDVSRNVPDVPGEMQENAGEIPATSGESAAQFNLIESNLIEVEENANTHPSNVVPFPSPHNSDDTGGDAQRAMVTHQVAQILHLAVTPALTRVVGEFVNDPKIALLSEADAAHEYINDSRHNHKQHAMSPAFFRRWLRRERGDYTPINQERPATQPEYTITAPGISPPGRRSRKSLMNLEEQYRQEMEKGTPAASQ